MTALLLATLLVFVILAVVGAASYWLDRDAEHGDTEKGRRA